jgi:hypothetical protein
MRLEDDDDGAAPLRRCGRTDLPARLPSVHCDAFFHSLNFFMHILHHGSSCAPTVSTSSVHLFADLLYIALTS